MSSSKSIIWVKDKIYIPRDSVDEYDLAKHYEKRFYDEGKCRNCEYKADRHSYLCDTCDGFKDHVILHSEKVLKGVKCVGIPIGDKKNVQKRLGIDFDDFKIKDRRNAPEFDYKIKVTIDPFDYQEKLIKKFIKKGAFGFLVAPPRSGKTFMMLDIMIRLGLRAILLASQHEYIQQFIWHIEGNEEEGIPKCTNLPELEKKYKKKLYGFPKTEEDYNTMQIMAMTYQTYLSEKGKKKLKWLVDNVGTLAIDEADQGNANHFSKVISKIPAKNKIAATGTVARKDKKDYILKRVIGPVLAESVVEMLPVTVHLHNTERAPKYHYKNWVAAMKWLSKDKKRNQMIVKQVIKDLKNGHNIVIPVAFTAHVKQLVDDINTAYGSKIAEGFMGGGGEKNKKQRKEILSRVKEDKTKVIVGIRRLVQRGLNVKQWSAIYTVIPISNEPNYKQETSRVRTPLEGKNSPIVRLFYEEGMGQSIGCARNCVRHMMKFKYHFSKLPKQREMLEALMNSGRKRYTEGEEFEGSVTTMKHDKNTLRQALGKL